MNRFTKLSLFKITLLLFSIPLLSFGGEGHQNGQPDFSVFEAFGYHLEKYMEAPPVVSIHFDHCPGSPLAREKRITKGILLDKNKIVAPADYFVDPCAPPISLPKKVVKTSGNYFCHDQRIKKIAYLSLISHNASNPEVEKLQQYTILAKLVTTRVFNELNFDGSNTIDAILCHKVENGHFSPHPALAILSLSERAVSALPDNLAVAETKEKEHSYDENTFIDSISIPLRNNKFFQSSTIKTEPDQNSMLQLMEAAQQLQHAENSNGNKYFDIQPSAFLSKSDSKHTLHAIINDWQLIDEIPPLKNLPDYSQRHPNTSILWKALSPATGTIGHTLGMVSTPTSAEAFASATITGLGIASTTGLLNFVFSMATPNYSQRVTQLILGLVFANGFYRWATSEY